MNFVEKTFFGLQRREHYDIVKMSAYLFRNEKNLFLQLGGK